MDLLPLSSLPCRGASTSRVRKPTTLPVTVRRQHSGQKAVGAVHHGRGTPCQQRMARSSLMQRPFSGDAHAMAVDQSRSRIARLSC
eukprot:4932854-Pleurochrysis_carterae.AAC.2